MVSPPVGAGTTNPLELSVQQKNPEPQFKTKILAYRGDSGACWYYRIHLPLAFLTKRHPEYGAMVSMVAISEHAGKFDLAILQRQYHPDVFEAAKRLKKAGAKLVYDIDDDIFHVPDWNPASALFGQKLVQKNVEDFLRLVDAVWVATEPLKELYAPYNDNIYVLPNSIAFEAHSPSPNNSLKKVVLWQGSGTHAHDLKILNKVVDRLTHDEDVLVKMWFAHMPRVHTVPAVEFKGFHAVLSQVDACIGLAPLIPCTFNESKSNLKFLEYAAQKIAVVASNYTPYASSIVDGANGFLISNNNTWYDAIRFLLDNPPQRKVMVENALLYVRENFDLSKNYILWKNAIDAVTE